MEGWALITIIVIVAGVALSAWRKIYFTIVASVTCVLIFAFQQAMPSSDILAFMPHDLSSPERFYTVLTSMYAHDPFDLGHLMFNVLGLVFIGMLFEQRIGVRPFILLYLLSGLCGTLAFAAYYWSDPSYAVLGASGAVSGVLGGFARLYPNERMMFIFLPGYPMRVVYIVFIFVAIQIVYATSVDSNVAWQSHLAGLAAGVLLAPVVARIRPNRPVKARVSILALRKLAVTPELRSILRRIESEEVPDVRSAWIGHFMSKARCPTCGAPIKITGDSVTCNKGHML